MSVTVLVAAGAALTALAAGAVTATAAQLRQRAPHAGIERSAEEEAEALTGAYRKRDGVPTKPLAASALGAALLALLAIGGVAVWLKGSGRGRAPGPGQCARRPSLAARLRHAASLGFSHTISTRSATAQALFNLGLVEEFNFNQLEADRAFTMAISADPFCSRCWWGKSFALGPGANRAVVMGPTVYPSFSPADFPAAQEAAFKSLHYSREILERYPEWEAAQIDAEWGRAAAARFPNGSQLGAARDAAELDYGQQVAAIGRKWRDPTALAIAAEAHMNLSPWDYYEANGTLRATAAVAEKLIEEALALDQWHPLAIHLLIHVSEESSPLRDAEGHRASRAEAAASRMLDSVGPWSSMGHLLHMPSHTFVRVGRYNDAVLANIRAYEADLADTQACRSPYTPEHNTDMLIYSAIASGQHAVALRWARVLKTQQAVLHTAAYGDTSFAWAWEYLTHIAFGQWAAVRVAAAPGDQARHLGPGAGAWDFSKAVWHFGRGLAFAAAKDAQNLAAEFQSFKEVAAKVPQEEGTLPGGWPGIYGTDHLNLLAVYRQTLQGALHRLNGDLTQAVESLRGAVAVEGGMSYFEPPRLFQPPRQCLGALLLEAARPAEAEAVFREDLKLHPDTGRALEGLARALDSQGQQPAAAQLRSGRLAAAWLHADVPPHPCPQLATD
mmetsp:Transcript_9819/g.29541  ORF Transcript_9819/g.29541 Transcript_9819/m.29541 type:complete len:672 (+) Transcript_9819:193-2208(+)|eukprot:CAMPEP_0206137596 /NCGR_PEP_ID=MMETSP1473-20131121/2691_1 /ASSEMBLY_ACC=CAM_ASM_001109 /TAXON_ID=1461547 /ORGANISM="Stichococcus sp, Strain RCC1054" /LENGTH=671 /DNA_ID=CAMNT_0053530763 /DNA_START=169 /DNA_END=2184 /DNA_ORIENTATION=-